MRRKQDVLQIAVPFTPQERKRVEEFIAMRGLKKGIFTKIALLEHIERAEETISTHFGGIEDGSVDTGDERTMCSDGSNRAQS